MEHAVIIVDGTEIDPNTFYDRCGAILHLVRAVGVASREAEPSGVDSWATHDACMGIATLAESLEQDLAGYFRSVTTKPRDPKEAASEAASDKARELRRDVAKVLAKHQLRVPDGPEYADLHNGSGESSGETAQH